MLVIFVTNNFETDRRLHKTLNAVEKVADKVIFIGPLSTQRKNILSSLSWRIGLSYDKDRINEMLINACITNKPDFVFVIKGNYLFPNTLKKIKRLGIKSISYSLDDLYLSRNRSLFFRYGMKYYDLVVTTKSHNLNSNEFPKWGAKKILFQYQAFDPDIHKQCDKSKGCKFAHDVVFVGSYEKDRHEQLEYLADNKISVHIYSPGWKNKIRNKKFLFVHDHHLYFEDFSCSLGCSKISLNFLRKINRDLHTSRSLEIPACGGFMLAERTNEHLNLFKEGIEAEYFSSKKELLNKIKYYLENEAIRKGIAIAGHSACYNNNHTYFDRISEIFS